MTSTNTSRKPGPGDLADSEDYYQLLGVAYSANKDEITKAYRMVMKRAHPDRRRPEHRAAAEERAKLINRAYAVLSHPDQKRAYDESIKVKMVQGQIMSHYFGGFGAPGGLSGDQNGESLRRKATTHEKVERRQANRSAIVTILIIFGGMTAAIIAVLVVWTVLSALLSTVF